VRKLKITRNAGEDNYHGVGHALAAVSNDEIVELVYLRDILPGLNESDTEYLRKFIRDKRIVSAAEGLSKKGAVFVGKCSNMEFTIL
jgi:hypothetical protein